MDVSKMFESESPWLKAADYPDMNRQLVISEVGTDTLKNADGSEEDKVWVKFDKAPKPIIVSKTNGRALVGAFGGDIDKWPGQRCLLTVKVYHMEHGKTTGWIITPMKESPGFDDEIPW